jgi:hypothetical protein
LTREVPAIELRTAVFLVLVLSGGYFAWERYSNVREPASISSTPNIATEVGTTSPPSATRQYTDVVRYMTADGKFGMTDDQSKVPPGAKILSLEQREVYSEQRTGDVANRLADNRRNDRVRSGRALLTQLEQEQAAQKAQRDAEDAAPSSSPRSPCGRTSWGAVVCSPSRSRSVDEVSVHP